MKIYKDRKKLVAAKDVADVWMKKLGFDPRKYAVFEIWDYVLGRTAAHARAVGIKGGKLYVAADSSSHLHEIRMKKRQIMKKLNGYMGQEMVKDIIIRIGDER